MPAYVKITHEGIEKIKDRVSPEILQYLKQGLPPSYDERLEEKLKQKLKALGADEENIIFIISCFKTFTMPENKLAQKILRKAKKKKMQKEKAEEKLKREQIRREERRERERLKEEKKRPKKIKKETPEQRLKRIRESQEKMPMGNPKERPKKRVTYLKTWPELESKEKSNSPIQQYSHYSHLPDVYKNLPKPNYQDDT